MKIQPILWWTFGLAAVFVVSQMLIFPTAVGEILRMIWSAGLALLVIAIFSNFFSPAGSPFSSNGYLEIVATFLMLFFAIFFLLSSIGFFLLKFRKSKPFAYKRTAWIDRDPSTVFKEISIRETNKHWNPKYKSIEKDPTEANKYNINISVVEWDKEQASVAPTTVTLTAKVLANDYGVSQTTVCYAADAPEIVESTTFVVAEEKQGTRFSTISSTTEFYKIAEAMAWLTDHFSDYFYCAKEQIEGLNSVAIYAVPRQTYILERIANKLSSFNDGDGLDQY